MRSNYRFGIGFLATLLLSLCFAGTGLAQQREFELTGELDLRDLSGRGVDVLENYSGEPDYFGVMDYYRVQLPEFETGVYYASGWWPSGGNRVYPNYVTNNRFTNVREGGMFLLLKLESGDYLAILPLVGASSYTWFAAKDGDLVLCLGNLGQDPIEDDAPRFSWARSECPYTACRHAFEEAISLDTMTARMRSEKEYPEAFKYIGWCSWEEYKCAIDSDMLVETVRKIEESGVPIRYIIMDAGHQHYTAHQALFGVLVSFNADPKSFPNGYEPLLNMRKEDKVRWMGVWIGHLAGSCAVAIENELGDLNETLKRVGNRLMPRDNAELAYRFYDEFIRQATAGFDFTKVDFQSRALGYYTGANNPLVGVEDNSGAIGNPLRAAANTTRGLERATHKHLNGLINCNGHNAPTVLNWRYSAVSRCSEDYAKGNRGAARRHIYHSYASIPWIGQLVWGDHDMFHSNDPLAARMMAVSKSMSGAPIYLSDNPGEFEPENIWPMCYQDGRILRPLAPAAPLEESLFIHANRDGKAYRAIAPLSNSSAAIVVYNLLDNPEGVVEGSISAADYVQAPVMIQPYEGRWDIPEEGLVLFDWYNQTGGRLDDDHHFNISGFGDKLYLLTPIENGWSVIGRSDKFLSPVACSVVDSSPNRLIVELEEAGPLTVWSASGTPKAEGLQFENIGQGLYRADMPVVAESRRVEITR